MSLPAQMMVWMLSIRMMFMWQQRLMAAAQGLLALVLMLMPWAASRTLQTWGPAPLMLQWTSLSFR
jgi:hypothetical protein